MKNDVDKHKEFEDYLANKQIYPAGPSMPLWAVAVALVIMVTLWIVL